MRRLKLAFADPAQLSAEVERNIAMGGAQIPSRDRIELREFVEVELEFSWRHESLVFEAEVVFCGSGQVAVQFRKTASELRADLAAFMTPQPVRNGERRPEPKPLDELGDLALELRDLPKPPPLPQVPDPLGKTVLRMPREAPPLRGGDPLADVGDRRKATRSVARVPARLAAPHVSLEGRTRDLSETGVLVSADASELPLGKQVELELQHPESGERIAVKGRVSRHVETEGTVAAVGLQFEEPEERRSELRNFVAEVKRAESERARSGIAGRIEELGMPNLIQMLGQSSPLGTLTATHGDEEATIAFQNGALRYALLGPLRGVKALARALTWSEGAFSFTRSVDAVTDEPAPIPLQNALLEATRQLDELARGAKLDMKRRFDVDRDAAGECDDLDKTEAAVLELATAGLTVRRMIDVIPDSDGAIQDAIRSLLERGVLKPKG
jgi:Tfp pilus assembly protein PilZ